MRIVELNQNLLTKTLLTMVELKFTAEKTNGQAISGSLSANTYSEGKKKVQRLAAKNQLKIRLIEKKSTFLYKVRKGNEKPITGEGILNPNEWDEKVNKVQVSNIANIGDWSENYIVDKNHMPF